MRYRIVLRGRLSETLLTAFPSLRAEPLHDMTVLEGELDQAALFGVLAQIEALALELVEIRRIDS